MTPRQPRTYYSDPIRSPPTIVHLNNDNYPKWLFAIKALLTRKGLWDITSKPTADTRPMGSENAKPVKAWCAKVAEARAELILNVDPSQYPHIQSTEANTVWEALRSVHQARSFGTRLTQCRTFWCMAKHADQTMTSWVADVCRATYRLEEIGATVGAKDMILVLTNSLPASYFQLIVSLDSTLPSDLNLEYVVTRLLNEEAHQMTPPAPLTAPDVALTAFKPRTLIERITCFKCGQKGDYQHDCQQVKDAATTAHPKEDVIAW